MQNKKEVKQSLSQNSFFPKNQRGQGLSTNAIILIVLGVVVLVILIAGFTMGWKQIASYLSSNNVNTIVKACSTTCSTDDIYGYCSVNRKLVDAEKKDFTETCEGFAGNVTYGKYGIQKCQTIECPVEENTSGSN